MCHIRPNSFTSFQAHLESRSTIETIAVSTQGLFSLDFHPLATQGIIYNLMLPTIDIYMDPQQFTFTNSKGQSTSIATKIYISGAKGRWEIVAVGDTDSESLPDAICIPLFEADPPPPVKLGKVELLQWFFHYGIEKSLFQYSPIWRLFRPKLILHGLEKFQDLLKGYESDLFTIAVLRSGIKSVQFK